MRPDSSAARLPRLPRSSANNSPDLPQPIRPLAFMIAPVPHYRAPFCPLPETLVDSGNTQLSRGYFGRNEPVPLSRCLSRCLSRWLLFVYNGLGGLSRCPVAKPLTRMRTRTHEGSSAGQAGQWDNNNIYLFFHIYFNRLLSHNLVPLLVPLCALSGTECVKPLKTIKYWGFIRG